MKRMILATAAALALVALIGCSGTGATGSSTEGGSAASPYADGTYVGTGKGHGGEVSVVLSIANGVITVEDVQGEAETPGIGGAEAIADGTFKLQIEEAQGAGIDGVTGATETTNGIREAVDDALAQAMA